MNKDYFNVWMNKIGFRILGLKEIQLDCLVEEIESIEKELDEFKEICLTKLGFDDSK